MPGGGELTLRIAHDAAAGLVDLTVRDTGSGIPREQLPKIFDRYFTTKSGPDATGKGGTGVGLSTCRDIVEAHHGRIRVESTVGKGTAFTVRLPVWREPTKQPRRRRAAGRAGRCCAGRVALSPLERRAGRSGCDCDAASRQPSAAESTDSDGADELRRRLRRQPRLNVGENLLLERRVAAQQNPVAGQPRAAHRLVVESSGSDESLRNVAAPAVEFSGCGRSSRSFSTHHVDQIARRRRG